MRWTVALQLGFAIAASTALAGDGVIEINQAKALAGGVDACDSPGFPVSICKSGSYRLTSNLDVPRGEYGVFVSAGNVSLDLGGMTIAGTSLCLIGPEGWVISCTSHGAPGVSASAGIAVHRGTVTGFDACVSGGPGSRVADLTVSACVHGVFVSGDSQIERVIASGNTGSGILSTGPSRIADVAAAHNRTGVTAGGVLTGITASNNSFAGIGLLAGASLHGFQVEGNGVRGIDAAADGILVSTGTIRDSGVSAPAEFALVLGQRSGYREVVITSANGGNSASVLGGTNLGDNLCQGVPCP